MTRKISLDAYNKIKENGLLSKRRLEVYHILFHNGPLTAHEVVAIARQNHPLSNQTSFNARLSELRNRGVVFEVGFKTNPVSLVENILWDVTDSLPAEPVKTQKLKCTYCNGTGHIENEVLL